MAHREENSQTAETKPSQTFPFGPTDTLAIMFDAGLPGMPILGCSGALVKAGVGEVEEGLLDLVPADEASDVDDWVFSEFQNLEESESRCSQALTTLQLVLPRFEGQQFDVKSAWLEVPPAQAEPESEDSIPMVLKVHGLTVAAPMSALLRKRMPPAQALRAMMKKRKARYGSGGQGSQPTLASVQEGDEVTEDEAEEEAEETEEKDAAKGLANDH